MSTAVTRGFFFHHESLGIRLSNSSFNAEIFNVAIAPYNDAVRENGHNSEKKKNTTLTVN